VCSYGLITIQQSDRAKKCRKEDILKLFELLIRLRILGDSIFLGLGMNHFTDEALVLCQKEALSLYDSTIIIKNNETFANSLRCARGLLTANLNKAPERIYSRDLVTECLTMLIYLEIVEVSKGVVNTQEIRERSVRLANDIYTSFKGPL
jgi:hypothetical protein